jgi:UDP-GlcNAc:undecaprenyl-phosphate/decaprenyl-phosphate GlcNAc-1-phosphate transferase
MRSYLLVFATSSGAVALLTPLVRLASRRFGAIDQPSDRKVHPRPTPTLGGVGLLLGVVVGLAVAWFVPVFRPLFRRSSDLQGTLAGGVVICVIGAIDDVRNLSVPSKVAGQVLAAGVLILFGVELLFFWFPFGQGIVIVGSDLAVPLTVVWVLILVNAVNLIDGLDGLAAGIVAIGAVSFFIWTYASPSPFTGTISTAALLSAITAGVCVGFLPWNFHQARIFMGDSGSMLLGLLLASATISGVGHNLAPSGGDLAAFAIPVAIPAIVLAVPLLDVALAIFRRLRRGRPVFAPDKEHIHHQLQEIGHTHRRTVLIMYLWSVLLAGSGLAVSFINGRALVGSVVGAAALLIALTYLPSRIRRSRRAKRVAAVSSASPDP